MRMIIRLEKLQNYNGNIFSNSIISLKFLNMHIFPTPINFPATSPEYKIVSLKKRTWRAVKYIKAKRV